MNNIVLIGFMGCGKSTVGIRLSYKLRRSVEDTDKFIEKKEGRSISRIFSEDGEAGFREMETACLRELLRSGEERILATGGGLPMRMENRELLKQLGCVVYLRISPECAYERVKNDQERPLLQCGDPLARIRALLDQREPVYRECADIIVDVDGRDMEEILEEIVEKLRENGRLPKEESLKEESPEEA